MSEQTPVQRYVQNAESPLLSDVRVTIYTLHLEVPRIGNSGYSVRVRYIHDGGLTSYAPEPLVTCTGLEEAIQALPPDRFFMGRREGDAPDVMGCWI